MEQWEKDYIDAVSKAKQIRECGKVVDCSYEEGYDSSRWIEIKNADGTKFYVPKESAFNRREAGKKKSSQTIGWTKCRKFLKVTIGILLILILLAGILFKGEQYDSVDRNNTVRYISLQGFIQGKLLGGTYINGYGFADMMHFFQEMQEERHDFLNNITENINSLSEIDVETWSRVMNDRETELEKLKYSKTYQQYVDAEKQVFEQQKELLTLVKYNAEVHTVLEMYYQLAGADVSLRNKAVEAMKKNGIDYTVNENGLRYWYKQY